MWQWLGRAALALSITLGAAAPNSARAATLIVIDAFGILEPEDEGGLVERTTTPASLFGRGVTIGQEVDVRWTFTLLRRSSIGVSGNLLGVNGRPTIYNEEAGISIDLASADTHSLAAGNWSIRQLGILGSLGSPTPQNRFNNFVLSVFRPESPPPQVIPLPAAALMLLPSLAGLAVAARRRRS